MAPTLLSAPPTLRITPEPLTAAAFAPFGTVVSAPDSLPTSVPPQSGEELAETTSTSSSSSTPSITRAIHPRNPQAKETFSPAPPVLANQNTAVKISPISPFPNYYNNANDGTIEAPSGRRGQARMTLFSCYPRKLRKNDNPTTQPSQPPSSLSFAFEQARNSDVQSLLDDYVGENDNGNDSSEDGGHTNAAAGTVFDVNILERHPYTSQTFAPMGLPYDNTAHKGGSAHSIFLVIVAPTLFGQRAAATSASSESAGAENVGITNPPDLDNIKAFIARGDQAVTYAAGTWHAPMVVLGPRRVDFVVTQFMNGVADEDVQEVAFRDGIVVDVAALTGANSIWGRFRARL